MANILFVVKGTGGDLAPFPKIGDVLQQRGHQITLLSHCSYAALAQRKGWNFVALDTPEERQRYMEDGPLVNSPRGFPTFFRRHILPNAVAEFEAIERCCSSNDTIIVSSHRASLIPIMVSEKRNIPVIRLFAVVSELIAMPLMEEMYRSVLAHEIGEIREKLGLPPITDWHAWFRLPKQNLGLWAAWFALPENDWPVKAIPVGFIEEGIHHDEKMSHAVQELFKDNHRPILISAGTGLFTEAKFYAASAQACSLLNHEAVLVTQHAHLVPVDLPKQVRHFSYLSFASTIGHFAGIIHHGGLGTLALALGAGIPQLILASGGDRPDNGLRIQNLGVGEYLLPPRWEPEPIASALQRLLDSASVQENCRRFALEMSSVDAAAEACNHIEMLTVAGSHSPSHIHTRHTARLDPKATAVELVRKLSPEKHALLAQRLREKQKFKASQDEITGPVQLTSNQHWLFFDTQYRDLHHWNISSMVIVPSSINLGFIERTLLALLKHHDALRTRFTYKDSGWHAFIVPMDEKAPFETFDFSGLPPEEHKAAIEQKASQLQTGFNLFEGPLVRIVHFNLGANLPGRLLFIAHHLVVDGSSLPILIQDFQTAYMQLSAGDVIQLSPKTTSIQTFAERTHALAKSAALHKDADYWLSLPWKYTPLPVDFQQMEINTEGSIRVLDVSLTVDETHSLLRDILKRYKSRIMDVLLAALVYAISEWSQTDWTQFTILDSGRNILLDENVNLSRTVGLLVSSALVILRREKTSDIPALLQSVKNQLRDTPHQGIGYELLLRCSGDPDLVKQLKPILKNEVKFNYLGHFSTVTTDRKGPELFKPASEATGPSQNMQNRRAEILYIPAVITGGRLTVSWWYSENLHKRATIEKVANTYIEALRTLIKES